MIKSLLLELEDIDINGFGTKKALNATVSIDSLDLQGTYTNGFGPREHFVQSFELNLHDTNINNRGIFGTQKIFDKIIGVEFIQYRLSSIAQ